MRVDALQLLSLILGFALQSLSTMMLLFAAISAVDFVVSQASDLMLVPALLLSAVSLTLTPLVLILLLPPQLVVPAWPWYRRHRTKWLPAVPASTAAGQGEGDDEEDADHDKKE